MKKNIRHFITLTVLATGCIYGINKFIETTSGLKKLLNSRTGNFFEWRYGNIFYTKHGEGKPLLLIHDLHPASSSVEWSRIQKKLEKKYTVYSIDLLGCGRSDKPNLTYTNYMYVQLITDFIKKIIGEKTDVISTGDSCSFTLMAANMDNNIFDKIYFINPPSLESMQANPNKKSDIIKKLIELPIIGTFIYNLQMTEDKITDTFEKKYFYKKANISGNIKDYYHEAAHRNRSTGKYLYGSIIGKYTNINIIPALKKVENPIFIIGSREDKKSIENMESYVIYDENIQTASLSRCSMLPQLEDPDKLYNIILMFND